MSAVVVTGASGFLGQRVLARLAQRSDAAGVVGVDLVPAQDSSVEHVVLDLASCPVGHPDRLESVMEGADAVLHLAWSHSAAGRRFLFWKKRAFSLSLTALP